MSVAEQINRIKANIASTYTAAQAKGATMPQTQNSDNLAACVQSITTGGGGDTQFGLTVEQLLGTLDGEGNLTIPALPSITFTGLKSVANRELSYVFYARMFEPDSFVSFPDLTEVMNNGMDNCFGSVNNLTSADFPALQIIGSDGLTRVFYACNSLTSVDFPSLTTIENEAFNSCFGFCRSLATISFPALTNVQNTSFGNASYSYCFSNCTALTEIHFRTDMQTTIEAMTGYADKWGATNASIIFDL